MESGRKHLDSSGFIHLFIFNKQSKNTEYHVPTYKINICILGMELSKRKSVHMFQHVGDKGLNLR